MLCMSRAFAPTSTTTKNRSGGYLSNGEPIASATHHEDMRAPSAGRAHLQEDLAVEVEDHAAGVIQLISFSFFLAPLACPPSLDPSRANRRCLLREGEAATMKRRGVLRK